MKLMLLFNPTAGRGRAKRHVERVLAYLRQRGAAVDVHASTSPGDLSRVAGDSSNASYDRVVVCGGDGTVNLALRNFDLQHGTLAVIPLGSGNDFSKVTGVPRDWREACDTILDGTPRSVDVALANGVRFVCVAGLGFDSVVNAYANSHAKFLRGSAVYLYAILRVLPKFDPYPTRIRIDDRIIEKKMMMVTVGNGPQYGGGIRIVPDAQIDDGLLDYCLVEEISRMELLKTLPRAYKGSHVTSPFVEVGRAREIHVESETPLAVYADGEHVTDSPVTFEFAKEKLRVMQAGPRPQA